MQQTSKVSSLWRMRGELQTAVSCHAWKVTTYNYQTALRGEGLTSLNVPPPQCAPPTLSHYHPGEDLIGLSVSSASCTTPTFTPLQQLVILSLSLSSLPPLPLHKLVIYTTGLDYLQGPWVSLFSGTSSLHYISSYGACAKD